MQESGGRLADVMQSSESLGLPRNTITNPEESIKQGVSYFADVLELAGGDTELALQAITWVTALLITLMKIMVGIIVRNWLMNLVK
ncbi:lipoprotein, NLP/P60 family [Geomicrobium sp. JCM 19055]|nr:lipoprotein, NLP/P60 family [Geomicrobium sp. JCM 19055]